jgi:hypothetical protein
MSGNSEFLSVTNFNNLYTNIRDIINTSEGTNLDNDKKYKKLFKKLVISIFDKNKSERDVNKLNNLSINKCVPFLIDIISKEKSKNKTITPYDYDNLNDLKPVNFKSHMKNTESNDDFMKRYQEIENHRNMELNKEKQKFVKDDFIQESTHPATNNTNNTNNIKINIKDKQNTNLNTNLNNSNNDIQELFNVDKNNSNLNSFFDSNSIQNNVSSSSFLDKFKHEQKPVTLNNNYNDIQSPIINYKEQVITKSNTIKTLIIDTGIKENINIVNKENKHCDSFVVNNINIDANNEKVYLDNITIFNIQEQSHTTNILLKIDELNNNIVSNNSKFNNFINILNTSNNNILNINLNKKYIGKFNSEVLNNISVMVRNQDLNSIFNEDDTKNRIIFELIIR